MKSFLYLIVAAGLILAGCSDPASVPSNNQATQKEFIKIPVDKSLSSELSFSTTETIDGNKGGKIDINKFYFGSKGIIYVNAEVKFPAGAFDGIKTISMTVNTDEASVSFYPHLQFDKRVKLNLTYAGVDISGLRSSNVSFVFMDDNGGIEPVENDGVYVTSFYSITTLGVKNAKLLHFSRYGFLK